MLRRSRALLGGGSAALALGVSITACSTATIPAAPQAASEAPSPTSPPATATAVLAMATPTPEPTVTPAPPAATAGAIPSPEATPPSPPQATWPLDGAPAKEGDPIQRRPVVAKIDNHPDARPPTGLSFADVVVEAPAEAGITRFDAVFHHDLPKVVGPIRSARLIDLTLVPSFNGLFLHVGASDEIMAKLKDSPLADLDAVFHGAPYWRSADRPMPHNMYANAQTAVEYADRIGLNDDTGVGSLRFYPGAPPAQPGGRPGPSVRINYSAAAQTAYVYDAERQLYLRSIGGAPHVDAATGKQIAAANVVVMETSVTETDIVEDVYGNRSLQIDTIGEGEVTVFRDGRASSGTWRRPKVDAGIEFVDAQGEPILLKPGQTWIQIIPNGMPFTN